MEMIQLAKEAKKASIILASTATERKNLALKLIADYLMNHIDEIVKENEEDIRRSMEENLPEPLVKRLKFDRKKILDTVEGIKSLISLPDPVGKKLLATELDEGLTLYRVSCPIGS